MTVSRELFDNLQDGASKNTRKLAVEPAEFQTGSVTAEASYYSEELEQARFTRGWSLPTYLSNQPEEAHTAAIKRPADQQPLILAR